MRIVLATVALLGLTANLCEAARCGKAPKRKKKCCCVCVAVPCASAAATRKTAPTAAPYDDGATLPPTVAPQAK